MMSSIVDVTYCTLEEAIWGTKAPREICAELELVEVRHYDFDKQVHRGQLVVHRELAGGLRKIFEALVNARFPIERMIPIVHYEWDDARSMAANNTSAFNYRFVPGTDRLSHHARGRALDLNPFLNPCVNGTVVEPRGASYNPDRLGSIVRDGPVVQLFRMYGWQWGGVWNDPTDYHHFEYPGIYAT